MAGDWPDGVAFIADSQRSEAAANQESFLNLKRNLEENGMDPRRIPIIIQFNKRDLDDVRSDDELAALEAATLVYPTLPWPWHDLARLRSGLGDAAHRGPLIVEEYEGTTVVPPDATARLDEMHNVVLELRGAA